MDEKKLSAEQALEALNTIRSNVVVTQSAGWSNLMYPLVAILNAAGLEQFDPTEEQVAQHFATYGGAGGYPGNELGEPAQNAVWSARRALDAHTKLRAKLTD